ncbi:MAG: lamin tail domain-containing protein [Chloroflexi bacterium]|nr:lamin tail domain-containing protein [Chloroflexota bacterium]
MTHTSNRRWSHLLIAVTLCLLLGTGFLRALRTSAASSTVVINEVLYDRSSSNGGEFVELYALTDTTVTGWQLTDQDVLTYTFPALTVAAGEYIVVHIASGSNDLTGPVYHLYTNKYTGGVFNNPGDDTTLLDSTGTCVDYVAYENGAAIDPPPTGCTWTGSPNPTNGNHTGTSIALCANGTDTDATTDWGESGTCGTYAPDTEGFDNNQDPTPVLLRSFRAARQGDSVEVRWTTTSEAQTLGFRLWRGPAGVNVEAFAPVGDGLIPAHTPGSPAGSTYRFVDMGVPSPAGLQYRLEELLLDGSSLWYGPVEAGVLSRRYGVFLPMGMRQSVARTRLVPDKIGTVTGRDVPD